MGLFRYEAVDNKSGKVMHGAMSASDEQEVAQKLLSMGYTLRAVHTKSGAYSPSAAAVGTAAPQQPIASQVPGTQAAASASGVPISTKSIVPPRALASYFRQLATMVRSGIPLYQAFSDITHYVRDRRLRKVLPDIQVALQSGQKLSGAMAMFPNIFPVHTTASIWAGELSGKLELALNEVATDLEQEAADTLYGRIGWGLTKANVLTGIYIIPLCTITGFAGQIAIGNQEGGSGPVIQWITRMLLLSSIVAAITIAAWIIWGYIKRMPTVKKMLDGILLRVPVWGSLHHSRALARFLHVLDEIYQAGIGVDTGWDAASLTPRNSVVAERLRLARTMVPPNSGLTNLFTASGLFEQEYIGIAAAGEKSGQVPDALSNLVKIYEDRANSRRMMGRVWSISALMSFAIALNGVAVIVLMKGWANTIWGVLDSM